MLDAAQQDVFHAEQNSTNFNTVELRSTQEELESMYSKYQLLSCLRYQFKNSGFDTAGENLGLDPNFTVELLVQMHLHKRVEPSTMIAILRRFFEDEEEPVVACAQALEKAVEHDLLNFDPVANQLIVRFQISTDVQALIDQFQYPLPMVQPPDPVKTNTDTGYLTIRRSVILKDNYHDDDVCLDHINRVNAQALTINASVRAFIQNSWKNLDKPKPMETAEEFQARRKAFEKYDSISKDVIDTLLTLGDTFWLTHAYDKRGRVYARGYHVNYQGNDWNKACIEFAHKEPLR